MRLRYSRGWDSGCQSGGTSIRSADLLGVGGAHSGGGGGSGAGVGAMEVAAAGGVALVAVVFVVFVVVVVVAVVVVVVVVMVVNVAKQTTMMGLATCALRCLPGYYDRHTCHLPLQPCQTSAPSNLVTPCPAALAPCARSHPLFSHSLFLSHTLTHTLTSVRLRSAYQLSALQFGASRWIGHQEEAPLPPTIYCACPFSLGAWTRA